MIPSYDNDVDSMKEDREYIEELHKLFESYIGAMERVRLREGLEILMKISTQGNLYLTNTAPWDLMKKKEKKRCEEVLFILMATIRLIACLAEPYLPSFSAKIYEIMNVEYDEFSSELVCGLIKDFKGLFVNKLGYGGNKLKETSPLFAESK